MSNKESRIPSQNIFQIRSLLISECARPATSDNLRLAGTARRPDRHGVLSLGYFRGVRGASERAKLRCPVTLRESRPRREFLGIERNDRLECARSFHLVA
jgi:hypothetical protein